MRAVVGLFAAHLLAPLFVTATQAAIFTVPGSSPTIQGAINLAGSGDEVLVSPGIYVEAISFLGKNITVRSVGGPAATTITVTSRTPVVQFVNGEGHGAVLDGFTLTGGRPSGDVPFNGDGGGAFVSFAAPTIRNNVITGNVACNGGGIAVLFGSPLISQNVISGNRADCSQLPGFGAFWGGGISLQGAGAAVISGNTISGNISDSGSAIGMFAAGAPTIVDNVMTENVATSSGDCRLGGGTIWMVNESNADIVQNVIANNEAGCHGGIAFLVPNSPRGPAIVNNTIALNGGPESSGIYAEGFDDASRIVNNVILARPGATALLCTDIYATGPPILRNNIFYGDGGTAASGLCASQIGINGNRSEDPRLAAAASGNYHLAPSSPAIDAGLMSEPLIPPYDLDGSPRIQDGDNDGSARVDIGAFEAPRLLAVVAPVPALTNASVALLALFVAILATLARRKR